MATPYKWIASAAMTTAVVVSAASVQAADVQFGKEQPFSTYYNGETNSAHFTAINGKPALIQQVNGQYEVTLQVSGYDIFTQFTIDGQQGNIVGTYTEKGKDRQGNDIDVTYTYVTFTFASIVGKKPAYIAYAAGDFAASHQYEVDFSAQETPKQPVPSYETIHDMTFTAYYDGDKSAPNERLHGNLGTTANVTKQGDTYNVYFTAQPLTQIASMTLNGQKGQVVSTSADGKSGVFLFTTTDLATPFVGTLDVSVPSIGYAHSYPVELVLHPATGTPVKQASPFVDIDNANKEAIEALFALGILKEATHFNPSNGLTRANFALMLQRAFNFDVPATSAFTDIANYADEAQHAINALAAKGIIKGDGGKFKPAQTLTRKQAALMIYRLLQANGWTNTVTNAEAVFSDVKGEEATAVATLKQLNIIGGYADGTFKPNHSLTRNQMAKILHNALTVVAPK